MGDFPKSSHISSKNIKSLYALKSLNVVQSIEDLKFVRDTNPFV